ncbi:MAG: hypothetical protein QNJ84_17705 [Alphaproteobacteria bacterium]|nr:hypothetical protein [Alphaproteobacteria bacterium]
MNVEEVCSTLKRLEQENDVNIIKADGIALWPLIRQCIWTELLKPQKVLTQKNSSYGKILERAIGALKNPSRVSFRIPDGVSTVFVSQPDNLQKLPCSGEWFDRIVDPLLFLECHHNQARKYYLSSAFGKSSLFLSGSQLTSGVLMPISTTVIESSDIMDLFDQAGLTRSEAVPVLRRAYRRFFRWYRAGLRMFENAEMLQQIYLSSWYIPENMGIIAAAHKYGIKTIDVQHGKQGLYQGMYSWWTCIPDQGYQMVPDWFWCWGAPSARHILASSSERATHKPFVGGFPWPDYFRQFILTEDESLVQNDRRRILFSVQAPVGSNSQPIPDFVIKYLMSVSASNAHFSFRVHRNFSDGLRYCIERLRGVPNDRYCVHDGDKNLYNELLESTHHITAFSSCCYEAEMYGVPTLLFGCDAKSIYSAEIGAGRFSWTEGHSVELAEWLDNPPDVELGQSDKYIEASLTLARKRLRSISGGSIVD